MIYLGDKPIGIFASVPSFFNRVECGTFMVSVSGNNYEIPLETIKIPKGILVYNDSFDVNSDKDNKPLLGAYAALCILPEGVITEPLDADLKVLGSFSSYYVNWGASTNQKYPSFRSSRTEQRGIQYLRNSPRRIVLYGFGTGDYDFKLNIPYKWIAWE